MRGSPPSETVFAMQLGQAWSKTPGRSVPGLPLAAAFVALALAGFALHAIEQRQTDSVSQRSLAAASMARASHAVGMAPYAVLSILEYDDSIEAGRQAPVVFLDAMREARSSLDEAARLAPDKAAEIQDFKRRFEALAEKANPALTIGNTTPGLTRGAALSPSDLAQLASGAQLAAEPDAELQSLARDLSDFAQSLAKAGAEAAAQRQNEFDVALLILVAAGLAALVRARLSGRRAALTELMLRRDARRRLRSLEGVDASERRETPWSNEGELGAAAQVAADNDETRATSRSSLNASAI
jgi:hypothetical protein